MSGKVIASYDVRSAIWKLDQDYEYIDKEKNVAFIIKAGSISDMASVPRPLWALISPFDLSWEAPIIHDAIFSADGGRITLTGKIKGDIVFLSGTKNYYSVEEGNKLFLKMMEDAGVPIWRRYAAYYTLVMVDWIRQTNWN